MILRIAGIAIAVALLAGCGSASGSSLEDAADATAAETSRFEMSFGVKEGEKEYEVASSGAFDYPNERAVMTVSGSFPFFGEEVLLKEVRLIGRITYLRWVVKQKSYWMKDEHDGTSSDPNELLIPFPGSPTKPTDVLTRVLLASDENEELGREDVRDTETTHYRARVDLRKLVKQLPARERPEGDVVGLWGRRFVPVELWIDDQSRLRRITIAQPEDEADGTTAMTTAVELYDFGVEFDVEPPPADELISQDDFDKLIEPLLELDAEVSGQSDPVTPEEICESAQKELPKTQADRMCLEVKEKQ